MGGHRYFRLDVVLFRNVLSHSHAGFCVPDIHCFRKGEDNEECAGADEGCGNPVYCPPAVVDTDQSGDDDSSAGSGGQGASVYPEGISVGCLEVQSGSQWCTHAMTVPRSCKKKMSDMVNGARTSAAPAAAPIMMRDASSLP